MAKAHSYGLDEAPVETDAAVVAAGAEIDSFLAGPGHLNRRPCRHPANGKNAVLDLGVHR